MKHHTTKILFSISLLTIIIIGMSLFTQQVLRKNSENLQTAIDKTVNYTQAENWSAAETSIEDVGKIWSSVKGYWSALIDHQEIDNIDVTLSRLQMLVKAKELPSSLSEAAALKKYICHIPAKEKPSLDNLF